MPASQTAEAPPYSPTGKGSKGGNPNNTMYPGGLKQYIRDRVLIDPETKCWIWQRGVDGSGFPKARVQYVYWGVNRLAYTLWIGPIPEGTTVRQRCLEKLCCNPGHLTIRSNGQVYEFLTARAEDRDQCIHGHPWPRYRVMRFSKRDGRDIATCLECERIRCRKYRKKSKTTAERTAS